MPRTSGGTPPRSRRVVKTPLERGLGYRFRSRELLEQALRHRSAAHEEGRESFERLEFLGDAALSHAVALLLFTHWPRASEGQLTRARATLVRATTLASLAEGLGLAAELRLGGGLKVAEAGSALLADGLEAVLGGVLLDGGWRAFQGCVGRLLTPLLAELDPDQLDLEEPKSALQEIAQRHGVALPVYHEVTIAGPAHRRVYLYEVELEGRLLGRGEGSSKRAAQQAAARDALAALASGRS